MSEIDPWALPPGGTTTAGAGLPSGGGYIAPRPVQPLNTTLPFVVIGCGILYVLVSIAQIFVYNNQISVANQINNVLNDPNADTGDLLSRAQSSDNTVTTVSWIALIVFIGTLLAIRAWQASLNSTLGSVGARQAVFRRAGYLYFRGAWVVSILLSLFLSFADKTTNLDSVQDVINHDHQFMVYYGLRALVGVVLIVFAFRLKRISEEGLARITGNAPAPVG